MRRFAQLFAGRTDCYGTYRVSEKRADGKQKGKGTTHSSDLPEDAYDRHLAGKWMLGIVPIRPNSTVCWFAADIDVYPIDLKALEIKCQKEEIPFVVCRTKSGGAHLYCFIDGWVAASQARLLCRKWLDVIGYPKAEIFPKQDEIRTDDDGKQAIGNWINLPYYGGDDTDRYALGLNGERLTLAQFEQLANARSLQPSEVAGLLHSRAQEERNQWADAPPCIEKMAGSGIGEMRNVSLTHVAIYYLKSNPDNWKELVFDFNENYCQPPMDNREVNDIIKNVSSGKYQYLCKAEPMCSICDKDTCLQRKWGVGPQQGIGYASIKVDRLVKIASDPPLYIITINGQELRLSSDQWMNCGRFRQRVYEMLNILIPSHKQPFHDKFILTASQDMIVEDAPEEVSLDGQVQDTFRSWCSANCPRSRSPADISRGFPFYDQERDVIMFKGPDFLATLKRQKRMMADREVWAALRHIGAYTENRRIEGKQVKVWMYPVMGQIWWQTPGEGEF